MAPTALERVRGSRVIEGRQAAGEVAPIKEVLENLLQRTLWTLITWHSSAGSGSRACWCSFWRKNNLTALLIEFQLARGETVEWFRNCCLRCEVGPE